VDLSAKHLPSQQHHHTAVTVIGTQAAVLLGALAAAGQIRPDLLEQALVVGELSLDGSVRHVRGVLPMVALARRVALRTAFVPAADAGEGALIPDIEVIPIETLTGLVNLLSGIVPITPAERPVLAEDEGGPDWTSVRSRGRSMSSAPWKLPLPVVTMC
jgi:predicted ATPase with chaperone activity